MHSVSECGDLSFATEHEHPLHEINVYQSLHILGFSVGVGLTGSRRSTAIQRSASRVTAVMQGARI